MAMLAMKKRIQQEYMGTARNIRRISTCEVFNPSECRAILMVASQVIFSPI
jgi:hypothetical protein